MQPTENSCLIPPERSVGSPRSNGTYESPIFIATQVGFEGGSAGSSVINPRYHQILQETSNGFHLETFTRWKVLLGRKVRCYSQLKMQLRDESIDVKEDIEYRLQPENSDSLSSLSSTRSLHRAFYFFKGFPVNQDFSQCRSFSFRNFSSSFPPVQRVAAQRLG